MSGAQPASAKAQGAKRPSSPSSPASVDTKSGTPAQQLVNAYMAVQAKLAKDDAAGAKHAFTNLEKAAAAKDLRLAPEVAQQLTRAAAKGAAATKLADARVAFADASQALIAYLGSAKNPLTSALTVAHCPMALDNKGAKWLQVGEKIDNPYFGQEMLRCGTVEETVQPGKGLPVR